EQEAKKEREIMKRRRMQRQRMNKGTGIGTNQKYGQYGNKKIKNPWRQRQRQRFIFRGLEFLEKYKEKKDAEAFRDRTLGGIGGGWNNLIKVFLSDQPTLAL
ncbi:MAG: hypothetical protein EZS28_053307, partial [Streblomastix strix]